MKYSIVVKFIAILLAACALVAAVVGVFAVIAMSQGGMYGSDYDQWHQEAQQDQADKLAEQLAYRTASRLYSDCPEDMRLWYEAEVSDETLEHWLDLKADTWAYTIRDEAGNCLEESGTETVSGREYARDVQTQYLSRCDDSVSNFRWTGGDEIVYARYVTGPIYQVVVTLAENSLEQYDHVPLEYWQRLFGVRYWMIALVAVGLLLFAVCAVYLCCAAGRNAKDTRLNPGGLNRLPLDFYLVVAGTACVLLVMLTWQILENWLYTAEGFNLGAISLAVMPLVLAAVMGIGFCFAVAAQMKMRKFYWWHHSVIGFCLDKLWQGILFVYRALRKLFGLLPLIWQYLLIGVAMGFFPLLFFLLAATGRSFWLLPLILACLVDGALICYGGYAYGTLLRGAQRMTEGTLRDKIPTKYLVGSYRACAEHLNALADVATVAAKKQLKSERMKTELITNVSHDIKTPLTSIINYVDLLQKPHTPPEGDQYLEVLGRQSQRLKKLIEDLMEMSKATTGNLAVDITQVDAAEAVMQALGEFSDKLTAAPLTPVFRQPEEPVAMQADGRLTWRVLSNLLSNIVKYALPGTRVYIDLVKRPGQVLISLKNISREPLNISADELTERFVRGDVSRNTEGSGLGLNIAKSLMDIQKGHLHLLVDGDLFKVTLVFPGE